MSLCDTSCHFVTLHVALGHLQSVVSFLSRCDTSCHFVPLHVTLSHLPSHLVTSPSDTVMSLSVALCHTLSHVLLLSDCSFQLLWDPSSEAIHLLPDNRDSGGE